MTSHRTLTADPGMTDPKPDARYHHGDLRAALIERAIETVTLGGVEALSMRGLAKDLGVSHAAPARHFKSKSDLLAAIVAQAYGELTEAALNAKPSGDGQGPAARLNAMSASALRWTLKNRAKFAVMTNPDVSRFADEAVRTALRQFAETLKAAIGEARAGGFMADADPDAVTAFLIGSTLGVAMTLTDPLMAESLNLAARPDARILANLIAPIEKAP